MRETETPWTHKAQMKTTTYRNPKLLALAAEAPHCMWCHSANQGQVVACHSNKIIHGKGIGHKAHDIPAYLCHACHDIVDGRTGKYNAMEREFIFLEAVYESMVWLLQNGHLVTP